MTYTGDEYLTTDRVRTVYAKCFRPEGSKALHRVTVEGWLLRHTFSVRWLQTHREDIIRMLLCLPEGLRADEGNGGTIGLMVLRGQQTKEVWTKDMSDVEKLLALGLASGLMSFCAPRNRWASLPGGFPYVRVEITKFGVSVN